MAETLKYDPELLLAAVEGELSPSQKREVDRIRQADPRVARLLDELAADRRAVRSLPDPSPPHWIMDEVDRQLERDMLVGGLPAETQTQAIRQAHVFRRLATYGAIAAMLAVVGGVIIASLATNPGDDLLAANQPDAADAQPDTPNDGTGAAVAATDDGDTTPTQTPDAIKPPAVAQTDAPDAPDAVVAAEPKVLATDDVLSAAADAARDPGKLATLFEDRRPSGVGTVDDRLAQLDQRSPENGGPVTPNAVEPFPQVHGNQNSNYHERLMPKLPDAPRDPGDVGNGVEPTPESAVADPSRRDDALRFTVPVGDDRAASVKKLDELILKHGGARSLRSGDGATLLFRIPADRRDDVVAALHEAFSFVAVDKAEAAAPGLEPWPSLVPDYASILKQQLADTPDAETDAQMIELSVRLAEPKK